MLVDFHTHRLPDNHEVTAIINCCLPLDESAVNDSRYYFSAGIHPWRLEQLTTVDLEQNYISLEQAAMSHRLTAIGECGLDRCINVSLNCQQEVLEHHISLAMEYQLPLIIHCVRAYDELIMLVKKYSAVPAWLLHAFNGSHKQLKNLLQYSNCYFSFGAALIQGRTRYGNSLSAIPLNKLLLETDDSEVPIADIYRRAALLCNCSYLELCQQLTETFEILFKREQKNES